MRAARHSTGIPLQEWWSTGPNQLGGRILRCSQVAARHYS
jgi:hypothetical protein